MIGTGGDGFGAWVTEHALKFFPEILGGFGAYFLHELYHHLFKRPGRTLLGLLFRKGRRL